MRTTISIAATVLLATAVTACQGKGKNTPQQTKAEVKAEAKEAPPEPERTGPPRSVVFLETRVEGDWNQWQQEFNTLEEQRRQAGVVFHYLMRGAGDPRIAVLALMGHSRQELDQALKSTNLPGAKTTHVELVDSQRPKRPDDAHIGMVVHADMDNLKGFLEAFNGDTERRAAAGIVGYGLFKAIDEPNHYILHLEAEKSDPLKNYVSSNALAKVIAAGGNAGKVSTQLVGHIEARTYATGPTPPKPAKAAAAAPAGGAPAADAKAGPADAKAKPADAKAKPADAKKAG